MNAMSSLLQRVGVLASLSDEAFAELLQHVTIRTFESGENILKFGEPGANVCVLLVGEARVLKGPPAPEPREIGRLGPGDLFGEMSLLSGEPTSADIVAQKECQVACWSHDFFSGFVARTPSLALGVARMLTRRLRTQQQDEEEQHRLRHARRAQDDPYGFQVADGPRRILVLNCGSSSLKYDVIDVRDARGRRQGSIEPIGATTSTHRYRTGDEERSESVVAPTHENAVELVIRQLHGREGLEAVGHRVVHGGERYATAVVIDDEVVSVIREMARLAPLHNPANLAGIEACRRLLPGLPQVAVFDTAFHQTMPSHAYIYAVPYEFYQERAVRRYGFHGTSHHYVALQAATHLRRRLHEIKLITCHLGHGASLCAVEHGRSIDTSMGLTPLEGLVMGTRSGDVDPALVLDAQRRLRLTPDEVDQLLNRSSGLLGLSGLSGDMREVVSAADQGHRRAQLAVQIYCYRVKKYVGAYVAALGGLDALVFTAGVGENSRGVRARICQGLSYLGVTVDERKNAAAVGLRPGRAMDIADDESPVRVLVVPTDEQRMIAWETTRALSRRQVSEILTHREQRPIPIEVSAHHVHLQPEHVEQLFGAGARLTVRSELSQPGQYACEEVVDLIGPRGRVERVRVLGPERPQTQVEISRTEEFRLGIDAPIRASGDLSGSPGLVLQGAHGTVRLNEGVICALRHIHLSPEDALSYGLRDRDMVRVRVDGERPLSFGGVLVRVHPQYRLAMHVDTDEANAAEINPGATGFIEAVEERA